MNIELEKLRMQFEEWSAKQQLDQVATSHPYNENDIISAKQDDGFLGFVDCRQEFIFGE